MPSNFADMAKNVSIFGIFSVLMMCGGQLFAQPLPNTQDSTSHHSSDRVTQRIDSSKLIMSPQHQRYFEMMDSLDQATLKSRGYRIQIFSASGPNARKDALQKQAEFLKMYGESSAYTRWNYPNWVVRLGDFRTQLEALEFHTEIREMYPASFIVKDEIQVD